MTAGYSYELLNPRYYPNRIQILHSMPADDAARYAIAAIWSYFVQPVPWAESRAVRAYVPEQVAWYGMVLLLPFGVVSGLRRDRTLTVMLITHAAVAIVIVALTSGNVGTLIRHRSLVLLYLIWLAVMGAHEDSPHARRRGEEKEPCEWRSLTRRAVFGRLNAGRRLAGATGGSAARSRSYSHVHPPRHPESVTPTEVPQTESSVFL